MLFLGGVLRYRAPWFPSDGAQEGPQFSDFAGIQQQRAAQGHSPIKTPESGTAETAGLPAECKGDGEATSTYRLNSLSSKTSGAGSRATVPKSAWKDLFGGKPSTTAAADPSAEESAWKTKKAKKEPVSDPLANVLIQDGWSVPVILTFEGFRMADTRVSKMGQKRSKSKSRRPRASQQCGSDTWCSWELVPSRTSVRPPEVVLWRPTPSLQWSTSPGSIVIPMRGRRP